MVGRVRGGAGDSADALRKSWAVSCQVVHLTVRPSITVLQTSPGETKTCTHSLTVSVPSNSVNKTRKREIISLSLCRPAGSSLPYPPKVENHSHSRRTEPDGSQGNSAEWKETHTRLKSLRAVLLRLLNTLQIKMLGGRPNGPVVAGNWVGGGCSSEKVTELSLP